MRKYFYYFGLSITVLILGICMNFTTSCEGPAGVAGKDADEICNACHNESTTVLAKDLQASNSGHMTGGNFERNATDCAVCHTHEGFLERMEAGTMETTAAIYNPTPPNCRTCHSIHINYDITDFALRYSDPVSLWINGATVDIGKGNLCANCHQPRIPEPMWTLGGADVTITDSRWGPHHGTQSATLWGTAGYEITGNESYATPGSNKHVEAGCNTCHMATPYGSQAGGHSLNMTYDYHGEKENIAACTECHSSLKTFDYNGVQTETAGLLDSLFNKLVAKGWMNESSGLIEAGSSSPLTLKADEIGVIYNYLFVMEDKSHGVHNPGYTAALLKNSIQYLSQ